VNVGDLAPDFVLADQTGTERSLASFLAQGPVVLFFYPAAMTSGCTKESCHFRDLGAEFKELGAQRVGISMDGVERQAEFTSKNRLDYPLLSDIAGHVAAEFGVKRALGFLKVRRATFVIGGDRRIIAVIASEISMNVHSEKALEVLRSLRP
jgi:peroxiredoxin Q/BCP